MANYSETRESVDALLQETFPDLKYHGHGNNIGIWETDDMLDLTKPIGDSYWYAKFRLWVFIPNSYGMQIKVEAFIIHVCEWETMFEGYIEDISDIRRILGMQLGLPMKERMQELINDKEG